MPTVVCASLISAEGPHTEILKAAGFKVEVAAQNESLFQEDNLIAALKDCDAVIAGSEPYTRRVIENLPKLRVISRSGVGFDAVDTAACDDASIAVTTTPGVNHHSVAEHTIAMLMAVARGFPEVDRRVRENRWKRVAHSRVRGSVLGLVGLGRIGRAVATRAAGLGMKLVAFEPYPNQEFVEQWNVDVVGLEELLAKSDYVSLHCPAGKENLHLMNADRFAKMKPGSVLINTARGTIVDEAALSDVLRSGHLRAAALDVFEVEPLPADSPLLKFDQVLFSGHVAGLDFESHHDTFVMVAETIVELHNGGWPKECVQNLRGITNWQWDKPRQ